jgi:hypothetical protein
MALPPLNLFLKELNCLPIIPDQNLTPNYCFRLSRQQLYELYLSTSIKTGAEWDTSKIRGTITAIPSYENCSSYCYGQSCSAGSVNNCIASVYRGSASSNVVSAQIADAPREILGLQEELAETLCRVYPGTPLDDITSNLFFALPGDQTYKSVARSFDFYPGWYSQRSCLGIRFNAESCYESPTNRVPTVQELRSSIAAGLFFSPQYANVYDGNASITSTIYGSVKWPGYQPDESGPLINSYPFKGISKDIYEYPSGAPICAVYYAPLPFLSGSFVRIKNSDQFAWDPHLTIAGDFRITVLGGYDNYYKTSVTESVICSYRLDPTDYRKPRIPVYTDQITEECHSTGRQSFSLSVGVGFTSGSIADPSSYNSTNMYVTSYPVALELPSGTVNGVRPVALGLTHGLAGSATDGAATIDYDFTGIIPSGVTLTAAGFEGSFYD